MKTTSARNKQVRGNILYVCGIGWVSYFAFYRPEALNAFWVSIIGLAWFGTGFLNIVKGTQERKSRDVDRSD